MSIVILSRAPLTYFAGIPKFCRSLVSHCSHELTVLNYSLSSKQSSASVTRYHPSPQHGYLKEITFQSQFVYKTLAFSFGYLRTLFALASKPDDNITLFHYQHPDPFSAVCLVIAKLLNPLKVRILVTWHADIYRSYLAFSPLLILIDLFLFSLSDRIVFPTRNHFRSSFVRVLPGIAKKKCYIAFGLFPQQFIDHKSFDLICKRRNKSEIAFLSIGRLVPYKGYDVALNAFALLRKKSPSFRYDIVGSGPLEHDLRALVSRLDLDSHVFIHTDINEDDKSLFLENANCFLLTSVSQAEAFGLVQLEAFAYGLPVLNTFLANGVNTVAPPSTAMTLPPNSSSLLFDTIYQISRDRSILSELTLLSKCRSDLFSVEQMCDQYADLYASLI